MIVRAVFRFNYGTVAGWTEEIFLIAVDAFSEAALRPFVLNYKQLRTQFLALQCTLLDVVCNRPDDPTTTITIGLNADGVAGAGPNYTVEAGGNEPVFACVRVKVSAAGGKPRIYHFRGLADHDVHEGKVNWRGTGPAAFNNFIAGLVAGTAGIQRAEFDPSVNIVNNLTAVPNMFVCESMPDDIGIGDRVRVQTRVVGNGPEIYYTGRVVSFTDIPSSTNKLVEVTGWKHGLVTGGKLSLYEYFYPAQSAYALYTPNWCVYKKTGRAFGQFRGRASPRA